VARTVRHSSFHSRSTGLTPAVLQSLVRPKTDDNSERAVMSAQFLLTDAEWRKITAVCGNLPNDARPWISSFISAYRCIRQYKQLEWRYDEAGRLAGKTAELIKRIERYCDDATMPESIRPAWRTKVEGLDELVNVLTRWTERFEQTEKVGKLELKASGDAVRTLIKCLGMIMELDRSKEQQRVIATVLEIADPGMKKKVGWQIRTVIEEWRRQQEEHGSEDEYFKNVERDPRFQEAVKRLIPDLE
jgi:hypothetical protein